MQRRLAWPLRKDDTQISRSVNNLKTRTCKSTITITITSNFAITLTITVTVTIVIIIIINITILSLEEKGKGAWTAGRPKCRVVDKAGDDA